MSKTITITVKHASHKTSGAGKLVASGGGRKKTIDYPYELGSESKYIAAAKALCDAQGWTGLTRSTASPFVFTATAEG